MARKKKTTEEFIIDARKAHGDKYDYSLVEYEGSHGKVKIICPEHGVFEQLPSDHTRTQARGCRKCFIGYMGSIKRSTTVSFITKSVRIHGHRYDYSLTNYITSTVKVDIVCPDHGVFKQTPDTHLSGSGCPTCNSSKGETLVRNHLDSQDIDHSEQYTFPDLKDKILLRFDFAVHGADLRLIEYQGEQHYISVEHFGGKKQLADQQRKDQLKRDYCQLHKNPFA